MYTDAMARAFRSLDSHCPRGLQVKVLDNDTFITVSVDEKSFMKLLDFDKRRAIEYMVRAKKALEDNGAIVLLVREGGEE